MTINKFNVKTTRRLSYGLIIAAGTMLLGAFNLIGAGVSGDDRIFAGKVSNSVVPLTISVLVGLLSVIFSELADHPKVPTKGHPHSKNNYLESAFVYLFIIGSAFLIYGGYLLILAVKEF